MKLSRTHFFPNNFEFFFPRITWNPFFSKISWNFKDPITVAISNFYFFYRVALLDNHYCQINVTRPSITPNLSVWVFLEKYLARKCEKERFQIFVSDIIIFIVNVTVFLLKNKCLFLDKCLQCPFCPKSPSISSYQRLASILQIIRVVFWTLTRLVTGILFFTIKVYFSGPL